MRDNINLHEFRRSKLIKIKEGLVRILILIKQKENKFKI